MKEEGGRRKEEERRTKNEEDGMAEHRVKGLSFASVYVDDFERAYEFYCDLCWFQFYDPAGNILEALGGK
jgi:hypothetical protein